MVKYKLAYFFLIHLMMMSASCTAQKKNVEMVQCSKSNTGYKGRVPKEDMDKPNTGHDFYSISVKVLKKSVIEVVDLTVNNNGQCVSMKPQLDNGSTKMTFAGGETCYVRADMDENKKESTQKMKVEGYLTLKVNGKLTKLEIKTFESILPQ
jgi:hypothetical protein